MNIFFLDIDPLACAIYHCDKHVVKMPLETAQILSTVLWQKGLRGIYRETHKNHPVVKWAGASYQNYSYTLDLGFELCFEFKCRYGKEHACLRVIDDCASKLHEIHSRVPYLFTNPAQCMPDYCKIPGDPVEAYRKYYNLEKRSFATWNKGTPKPSWYTGTN